MMQCERCGSEIPEGATNCVQCGAPVPVSSEIVETVIEVPETIPPVPESESVDAKEEGQYEPSEPVQYTTSDPAPPPLEMPPPVQPPESPPQKRNPLLWLIFGCAALFLLCLCAASCGAMIYLINTFGMFY
jgi:hypothetical protein